MSCQPFASRTRVKLCEKIQYVLLTSGTTRNKGYRVIYCTSIYLRNRKRVFIFLSILNSVANKWPNYGMALIGSCHQFEMKISDQPPCPSAHMRLTGCVCMFYESNNIKVEHPLFRNHSDEFLIVMNPDLMNSRWWSAAFIGPPLRVYAQVIRPLVRIWNSSRVLSKLSIGAGFLTAMRSSRASPALNQ